MNVITLGTFDCFHRGHLRLLKKCLVLSITGNLTVGLNTDSFIKRYKGKPPVFSYKERKAMINEFYNYISVVPNNQSRGNAKKVILDSEADLIVIGSDWARKDYVKQLGIDWNWLDRHNIGVCYFNYTYNISTTEIKKRINEH